MSIRRVLSRVGLAGFAAIGLTACISDAEYGDPYYSPPTVYAGPSYNRTYYSDRAYVGPRRTYYNSRREYDDGFAATGSVNDYPGSIEYPGGAYDRVTPYHWD